VASEYLKLLKTATLSSIKPDADWHRLCVDEPWAVSPRNNLTVSSIKALGPLSKIMKRAFWESDL